MSVAPGPDTPPGRRSRWREGIDDRLTRIPPYRQALLRSMARFGDDFDREEFIAAYDASDPSTIEAVTALEGELGHIVNWLKQIAEFGYHELVRLDQIPKSGGSMLDGLVDEDVLTAADRDKLTTLVALRNRLQHDYPEVTPKQIHGAVVSVLDLLPGLVERYERMLNLIDG